MSNSQLTPEEFEWVTSVYKALGITLLSPEDSEHEIKLAIKENEARELTLAAAKSKLEDDTQVEAAVAQATATRISNENNEKLKDVASRVTKLKTDVKDHFTHQNDETDSDVIKALTAQVKLLLDRVNTIYAYKDDFVNFPSESLAFDKSHESAEALIQAAALEVKTKDTDGAQNSLVYAGCQTGSTQRTGYFV